MTPHRDTDRPKVHTEDLEYNRSRVETPPMTMVEVQTPPCLIRRIGEHILSLGTPNLGRRNKRLGEIQ